MTGGHNGLDQSDSQLPLFRRYTLSAWIALATVAILHGIQNCRDRLVMAAHFDN
jgi:hypothetical protein